MIPRLPPKLKGKTHRGKEMGCSQQEPRGCVYKCPGGRRGPSQAWRCQVSTVDCGEETRPITPTASHPHSSNLARNPGPPNPAYLPAVGEGGDSPGAAWPDPTQQPSWGPITPNTGSLLAHHTPFSNQVYVHCHWGEGIGTPLQYSCLENPMDGGVWWAAVHGVSGSHSQLGDFTFIFHFDALEKETATHSSVLAWRISGTGEPGGLPSMGSYRVRHD